ncbi:phosphatidylinositol kinase- protein kinase tor1 [Podochytrium sp. JEL0797]|nr:phosphatidylinositol kinase- protein kinase tor1 [Podochytrium sp. JEL0797]
MPLSGPPAPGTAASFQTKAALLEDRFRAVRVARSDEARASVAAEIRHHVAEHAKEVSGEVFAKFMQLEVNKRIFDLIHSAEVFHKLAGIAVIDSLIDFQGEDNTIKTTRFANYLRIVLPGSDPQISNLAAKALGHLAKPGGTLAAEFVEFEVKRALEWLQEPDRNESRRYAAVLVLKELALSSPTILFSYVPQILELIWIPLGDSNVTTRERGAEVLRACLQLMHKRESNLRRQWYSKIYAEAERRCAFRQTSDSLHGCLLVYRELFEHAGKFMESKYSVTCNIIFHFRENSDQLIRKTVVELFPILAAYDTANFRLVYLSSCVDYLIRDVRRERMNSSSSRASAVIKEDLIDGRQQHERVSAAFECLSMLCVAVGDELELRIRAILDLVFRTGLSIPLKKMLIVFIREIPKLRLIVQERFLNLLSAILCGEPYRHPGAPPDNQNCTRHVSRQGIETIILALEYVLLQELILSCARRYLSHHVPFIRRTAAIACCQVLASDRVNTQMSRPSLLITEEVMSRILIVAVTDSDSFTRQTVLRSLSPEFDHHLAQEDNVNSLFLALNDEVFVIREIAMELVGRLAEKNPAVIYPRLRQLLTCLLTELQYTSTSVQKEECVSLLCDLVMSCRALLLPYAESVMNVLLPMAKDSTPAVAAKSIAAIGEMSRVGSSIFAGFLTDIMPIFIEALQDQSSSVKREAALKSLGYVCGNLGFVISPFVDYPGLLDIFVGILKSEEEPVIRLETVRLMGILGAVDPLNLKIGLSSANSTMESESAIQLTSSDDEYYPSCVLVELKKILHDASLTVHHMAAIQAVMYMFETLGKEFLPSMPLILPDILTMMKTCPPPILEFCYTKLADIVYIVKDHIRPYLSPILDLVHELWAPMPNMQIAVLSLVEALATVLDVELKLQLPSLLPPLLQLLESNSTTDKVLTHKALHTLAVLGKTLESFLFLAIPPVLRLLEQPNPTSLKQYAIQTLGRLAKKTNMSQQCSKIVFSLLRVLNNSSLKELHGAIMDTFVILAFEMERGFMIFLPEISQVLMKQRAVFPAFDLIAAKICANESLSYDLLPVDNERIRRKPTSDFTHQNVRINQKHLQRSWDTSEKSTREDWVEWMRRLNVELLKQSPSHSLRSCASLAAVYNPLARALFNAAFLACWSELLEQFKEDLIRAIEVAITAPKISPDITQTLLNMAEFMEHDDKALPIDIRTLSQYAARCHAWAKALHYKELEYLLDPVPSAVESLISINNQLSQFDSAVGIVTATQKRQPNLAFGATWKEKLNLWDEALVSYEEKQTQDPSDVNALFGRMRCLQNLGEWDRLAVLCQDRFYGTKDELLKQELAPISASAAWTLGEWTFMEDCVDLIKTDSPDGAFFRSVLALHENEFTEARQHIRKARELLDTELMALVGESYNRAYPVVVRIQMLAELEEIVSYKRHPERQALIRKTWATRLEGCQKSVDVWQRILRVRALVISPNEGSEMWIKFANLCRKSGKLSLSYKTLTNLLKVGSNDLGVLDTSNNPPHVIYACLKHAWASGVQEVKEHAFNQLRQFTKTLVDRLGLKSLEEISTFLVANKDNREKQGTVKLLARCYVKLGEWQEVLEDELTDDCIPDILESFKAATLCDKTWYKAWHSWALSNVEVLAYHERINPMVNPQVVFSHVIPSIQGFFQSIALSRESSLEDTLRLLTLWFKYGYSQDVNAAMGGGYTGVTIDTWLQVIPQSLTVASQSHSLNRRTAAIGILDRMKPHSNALVEQVLLVSQELLRVAVLWHETWYNGIEDASKCYYGENDVVGMLAILDPLHQMLERGPETELETSFNIAYSVELKDAWEWCKRHNRTKNSDDLAHAWEIYCKVFKKLEKQLEYLRKFDLQAASPKLLAIKDLELAVPGTYRCAEPIVRIASIVPALSVMKSKQRPRRLSVMGSNGVEYMFLLKGREDIRQDERVMQLFGLVNNLLSSDPETFKRLLTIERFSVIPLSPNSGLIGWVSNTDTFNSLISEYRESRKILLNVEYRLMIQLSANYDTLCLMQKVEIFEQAISSTTGQDLFKVLWLKSKNSEIWLDRRTNYTRSLAVMSMVGYILGLGDRHPSNIMMERFTGKVVHIDFGDCFEVSGVEGNFRITCEHVMRVLRYNKDSLMAVLEAFVHDPLINWRLLKTPSPVRTFDPAKSPLTPLDLDNPTSIAFSIKQSMASHNRVQATEKLGVESEGLSTRAVTVINRVANKLTGKDFKTQNPLNVNAQVNRLILEATSSENLCTAWVGWCAFW